MRPPQDLSDLQLASRLASRAAHDLNNIAAVFSGHIFLLRQSAEPTEEAFEAMEKASKQLERLSRSLSRLAALGGDDLERLDLNELARMSAADSASSPNPVELDLEPDLPPTRGRKADLRQALEALLANAREASDPTVPIRVSTRRLPDGSRVVLAVEDAGHGIPPAIEQRVFEPLFSTREEKGRGIGLTVAAAVASEHGGTCKIERNSNRGATVSLSLPVR